MQGSKIYLKFICVPFPRNTHSLKQQYNICSMLTFDYNLSHEVKCGIFYSWCHVGSQRILDFGAFQMWNLRIRNINLKYTSF